MPLLFQVMAAEKSFGLPGSQQMELPTYLHEIIMGASMTIAVTAGERALHGKQS